MLKILNWLWELLLPPIMFASHRELQDAIEATLDEVRTSGRDSMTFGELLPIVNKHLRAR